jgi:hypothetical protein
MDDDTFREYRRLADEARYAQQHALDRALMFLAAGGFGAALTFLRTVPPNAPVVSYWLMYASGAAFGLSLMSQVCSMRSAVRAHERYLEELEMHYTKGQPFGSVSENDKTKRWNNWSWSLLVLGGGLLTFAVAVMISN